MKSVQTLLGDHQDSVVAREALRDLADPGPRGAGESAFTWGCSTAARRRRAELRERELPGGLGEGRRDPESAGRTWR